MEILVITLTYTTPARDTDAQTHVRQTVDTIRNAPGLTTSRIYHGWGHNPCYVILTTWADEESWQKAQEKHSPRNLLLTMPDLLVRPPEQWIMGYLWGYSRPSAPPALSAAHLTTVRPEQIEFAQRIWIKGLHQQTTHPRLAFAFLAREIRQEQPPNIREELTRPRKAIKMPIGITIEITDQVDLHDPLLLSFFSWANESEREEFYADPYYQAIKKQIESVGTMRIIALEAL